MPKLQSVKNTEFLNAFNDHIMPLLISYNVMNYSITITVPTAAAFPSNTGMEYIISPYAETEISITITIGS